MKFPRLQIHEWVLIVLIIALVLASCLMSGGCSDNTRAAVDGAVSGAASGAATGAGIGGLWGGVIGGGAGLFIGLAKALAANASHKRALGQVVTEKETILADVTRGVGDFLDNALDPADFAGITDPNQAVELAKRKLRESLQAHMTDETRAAIRDAKAKNNG